MRLFHFSDREDIAEFVPRAPIRHPDAEPFVYAIDEWHAPLYLFPRDCPRIGIWPLTTSSVREVDDYRGSTDARMRILIDRRFEESWLTEGIVRYEFDPENGLVDCRDHGVWVSKETVVPVSQMFIADLPAELEREGILVEVVDSLASAASAFFDFETKQFRTTLHISMIRMSLLPDWDHEDGKPTRPKVV